MQQRPCLCHEENATVAVVIFISKAPGWKLCGERSGQEKGVGYALNQWSTLTPFLDGRIREISNNGCERGLRAPVIGRKNWNWFGSKDGAQAAVVMMSLVQSCREHGINPLLYLRDVLQLVSTTPQSKVCDLTPRGWKAVGEQESRLQRAKDSIAEAVQSLEF